MGKAPAHDYVLGVTRTRKASTASIGPYAVKLSCAFSTCGKIFGRKGDLKRHELLHLGVKKHKCPECHKTFSQNSGLKTHMNVHTGAKPYSCIYEGCDAEFGDPSSHARHRKETHQVNYHYSCPVEGCISAIKRRSAFSAHLKAKHDMVPTSKDLDALKKRTEPTQSQRRKPSQARPSALILPELFNPAYFAFSVTPPHLSTSKVTKMEELTPPRNFFYQQRPEIQLYYNPNQSQQSDIQTLFTPVMSSSSPTRLSPYFTQSSPEALVDDFKYENYAHANIFYDDVPNINSTSEFTHIASPSPATPPLIKDDQLASSPVNPQGYSSSPSPTTPPHTKDGYRLSPLSMSPQGNLRTNAQIAYERRRYVPNMDGSSVPYQVNHKLYTIPQAQEGDYTCLHPQLDLAEQNPLQQWQSWGFS